MPLNGKPRAPKNRTLVLTNAERKRLRCHIASSVPTNQQKQFPTGIAVGDCIKWAKVLPRRSVDLLFLDMPYNRRKSFNGRNFYRLKSNDYTHWLDDLLAVLLPTLKLTATIYICGDWLSSHSIFETASKHLIVRNRITWEREKGLGEKKNWKSASEDIWFCTNSDKYTFNAKSVKLRKRVIAPYTSNGQSKDWRLTDDGKFRDTHASNLWTDISIPFWSMPENTDHPTQKSEKLVAKLLLASTNPGDVVRDPFLGSGTTSVVAKKLGRRCFGIELDEEYALLAQRRLEIADTDTRIQGFTDGVFWERNTKALQKLAKFRSHA